MKKLLIGIITWNCKDKLRDCLASIVDKMKSVDYEIVVVDNGSADGTTDMMRERFPQARLIENSENLGVAAARNQFLGISDAQYTLILDADTKVLSDNMGAFLEYMDSHPDVGIAGAKLLDVNGELTYTFRTLPRPIHVALRRMPAKKDHPELARHELRNANHSDVLEVEFVVGAFQLVRTEVIRIIGLLDDRMFYGFEDSDYCARALRAGYKVIYYPHFEVMHLETNIARKNVFSKHMYHNIRSYLIFYAKHRGYMKRTARGIDDSQRKP